MIVTFDQLMVYMWITEVVAVFNVLEVTKKVHTKGFLENFAEQIWIAVITGVIKKNMTKIG